MKKMLLIVMTLLSFSAVATNTNPSDTTDHATIESSYSLPDMSKQATKPSGNTIDSDKLKENVCKEIERQTGNKCDDRDGSKDVAKPKVSDSKSDNKPQIDSNSKSQPSSESGANNNKDCHSNTCEQDKALNNKKP